MTSSMHTLKTAVLLSAVALFLGIAAAPPAAAAESDDIVMISATTLEPGQTEQTYTLTVVNVGAEAVTVSTRSSAPPRRTILRYEADHGAFSFDTGRWVVDTLAPGAAATLTVVAM